MLEAFELNAEPRSDTRKGASRRLRRTGKVPGIIYGAGKDPEMIMALQNELEQHLENEAFYSHVLTVNLPKGKQKVVLKDVQRHPAKPFVLHFDLLRVKMSEKIRMQVPLHFIGEDIAPGAKEGGVIAHHESSIEVFCLPGDLPEFIDVDVSAMEIGDFIRLSEIVLPSGVEATALMQGPENDTNVVSITMVQEEVEEEVAAEEEGAEEAAEPVEGEEESGEES